MPTINQVLVDQYQEALAGSIHLLLIGATKMGKSDYVVQAAIDGYQVIYIDSDNGFPTILEATKNHPSARERIHYFNPVNMMAFVDAFLTLPIIRYNIRTRDVPNFKDKPDDRIVEIYPARIPRGIILSIDSWSSYCLSTMETKAEKNQVDLMDIDKVSREIYGGSGFHASQTAGSIQRLPFHVILQAHPAVFERKEKPADRTASAIKETDMIIRETTDVIQSTSAPHGATMGKYFNQVGWLEVSRTNQRVLDFRVQHGRMGGGTPGDVKDPRTEYRFSKLWGPVPQYPDQSVWIQEMSSEEMKVKAQQTGIKLGGAKPATPATPASPVAPAAGGLRIGNLTIKPTGQT